MFLDRNRKCRIYLFITLLDGLQKRIRSTNTVSITLVVYTERELLEIYQRNLPSTKIKHMDMINLCDPITCIVISLLCKIILIIFH